MRLLKFLFLSLFAAAPAIAHEFWIDAQKYQVDSGETIVADLRNGQNFKGGALSWFDRRIARAEALIAGRSDTLMGRAGDRPAISYAPPSDGLLRLIQQTQMDTITYRDPAKFEAFVAHKDLDKSALISASYPLTEGYRRYVKALVAVGEGRGQDSAVGFEIEFVALANPYVDELSQGFPVRLLYQGQPRGDAQIEVFARDSDGTVTVTTLRTDAAGEALIDVQSGQVYLLDSVILRKPDADLAAEKNLAWETLWAAMTFALP